MRELTIHPSSTMKKSILRLATAVCAALAIISCKKDCPKEPEQHDIRYSFVSAEKGKAFFTDEAFHSQITPFFIALMLERNDGTRQQWMDLSYSCIKDGTARHQEVLDSIAKVQTARFRELGIDIAGLDNIQYINMTMDNFKGMTAFTSSTHVYANMNQLCTGDKERNAKTFWHELWHIISRNNPQLRKQMYGLIGFHVLDQEIEIPAEVKSHILCNPDVERHDSYATFTINGKKTDCMLMLYAEEDEYEEFFTNFQRYVTTTDGYWLLALDSETHRPYKNDKGKYAVYNCREVSDFKEVMSAGNTGYCDDPEECMADNFAFAMMGRTDLPNTKLLEDIRQLLKNFKQ